ncbi:MAG TPA: DUF5684 domain-containing protein [Patescibacteria group bacterium]|nr:DUF5684 domain-containing protein [Patescibacteria group bacterium]
MNEVPSAMGMVWSYVFYIAVYVYTALTLMLIAKKTKDEPAWLAWIPIVNVFLMVKIAKMSYWSILLIFIPLVNIVWGVYLWWKIAEARGKSGWWGIAMIVPIVNFIAMGYLAFSE